MDEVAEVKRGRGRPRGSQNSKKLTIMTALPDTPAPTIPENIPQAFVEANEDSEILLGRDSKNFTPAELKMIRDAEEEFKDVARIVGARVYVDQAITAMINLNRHDTAVERERLQYRDKPMTTDIFNRFMQYDKHRERLHAQYTAALEALGLTPKDSLLRQKDDEKEDPFSTVLLRYATEIEARRARGDVVGAPSKAANALADSVGIDPSRYHADVIPDEDRDEILEASRLEAAANA